MLRYILITFLCINTYVVFAENKHIVVVTCSYNNKLFYKKNLQSIFAQKYGNYKLIYVDDCSTDGTFELVKEYIAEYAKEHNVVDLIHDRMGGSFFVTFPLEDIVLIRNDCRKKILANHYSIIHSYCYPDDIVVLLDGDDYFAHEHVLEKINEAYQDGSVWLTYGQFKVLYGLVEVLGAGYFCRPYTQEEIDTNAFRKSQANPSHLKTFYAGLFHRIKKEDLLYKDDFFEMAGDAAIMLPMLEMARYHFMFIDQPLVEYNVTNPLSDFRISETLQMKLGAIIRERTPYNEVKKLF